MQGLPKPATFTSLLKQARMLALHTRTRACVPAHLPLPLSPRDITRLLAARATSGAPSPDAPTEGAPKGRTCTKTHPHTHTNIHTHEHPTGASCVTQCWLRGRGFAVSSRAGCVAEALLCHPVLAAWQRLCCRPVGACCVVRSFHHASQAMSTRRWLDF